MDSSSLGIKKRSKATLSEIDPDTVGKQQLRQQKDLSKSKRQKTAVNPAFSAAAPLDRPSPPDNSTSIFESFTQETTKKLESNRVQLNRPRHGEANRKIWQLRCIHYKNNNKIGGASTDKKKIIRILLVHGATPLFALNRYVAESFGAGDPRKKFDHQLTKGHNPPDSFFTWNVNDEEKGIVAGNKRVVSKLYPNRKSIANNAFLSDRKVYVADVFAQRGDYLVYHIINGQHQQTNSVINDDNLLWSVTILMDGVTKEKKKDSYGKMPNLPMLVGADKSLGKLQWFSSNDEFLGDRDDGWLIVSNDLTPTQKRDAVKNRRRIPYFDNTGHQFTYDEKSVGFDGLKALHERVCRDFVLEKTGWEKEQVETTVKNKTDQEEEETKKKVKEDDDKISDFFNDLSIKRGSEELCKCTGNGIEKLSDNEYDMIAYPFREITLAQGFLAGNERHTYRASNGNFFTVRELGWALADFERSSDTKYVIFHGMNRVGPHTFEASWGFCHVHTCRSNEHT